MITGVVLSCGAPPLTSDVREALELGRALGWSRVSFVCLGADYRSALDAGLSPLARSVLVALVYWVVYVRGAPKT